MGLEGYKTEILAGFRLLQDRYPWLISRRTGGFMGRSQQQDRGGMALYHRQLKAQLRLDESQNGRF